MTNPSSRTSLRAGGREAPPWAALALTFANSLTTGAMTVGVFFIAKAAYDFSARLNLFLGLLLGATYIAGALLVGPALRRLAERSPRITQRGAIAALCLAMAAAALFPWLARDAWAIWPVVALYSALNGASWPLVESYVSGARRGVRLRRMTAWFNLTWSSAIVVTLWAIARALKTPEAALSVLAFVALAHTAIIPILLAFPSSPPEHPTHAEPHPQVYERLLSVFRRLLPVSYVLSYCLNPLLPDLIQSLEVPDVWATPLASTWSFTRMGVFFLFAVWSGWHGRWRTPIWTTGCLLAGFTITLTASSVPVFAIGLALFGAGMGGIYAAALYYVMSVGSAEVEAGGSHEALIGLGYTLGPACGLAGAGLAQSVPSGSVSSQHATLAVAGAVALAGIAWAAHSGRAQKQPQT